MGNASVLTRPKTATRRFESYLQIITPTTRVG